MLLALLLFWAVGAYNRLVRLRSAVIRAFGGLDALLLQRLALLGQLHGSAAQGPSVAEDAHEGLMAAAAQFGAALAVARAQPLDADAGAALAAGGEVLEDAWRALQGAGGDSHAVAQTREQHAQLQAQVLVAQQRHAKAVQQYNQAIAQFPANMLAWAFGFKKAYAA